MSSVLEGNFAIHRATTASGKNAILVIPEPEGEVLLLDECPLSFERVIGGENPMDSYVTVTYANGDKAHLGPELATRIQ